MLAKVYTCINELRGQKKVAVAAHPPFTPVESHQEERLIWIPTIAQICKAYT